MENKVNIENKFSCNICNKNYASMSSLCNHNKKFHIKNSKILNNSDKILKTSDKTSDKTYNCRYCNKIFINIKTRWSHEQKCKESNNINKETELEKLKEKNKEKELEIILKKKESTILRLKLKLENDAKLELENVNEKNKQLEEIINKLSLPMNNQLINMIEDKNKKIEELNYNLENNKVIINKEVKTTETLTLNNIVIISRSEDNYINATQLCQAGGKQFNDWFRLNTTKQLIDALKSKTGIPVLDLIEINKGGLHLSSWIHPDLAIQLAQWISPIFALQVSSWIRTLFTNGNVSIDVKILEDKNNELKIKNNKIKLLEDMYLKKHKRIDYPERNVIYMLTTEDNKKKRNYVIGKAINLTNRLSSYNKTAEHEVVYFKECKSEENMNAIENMVLLKLRNYQEKANRDRFILPLEKDIYLFTNIIDECINFIEYK